MKRPRLLTIACLLGVCLWASSGFAQDQNQDQRNLDVQKTVAETEPEEKMETVGVTNFAVRPSAGAILYKGNQRFAGGLLMDFNLLSSPVVKVGPSFGALYSSLSGNDFFSGVGVNNNNYIFQIPGNLKVTFAPDPGRRLQIGAHGGANVIRSTGSSAVGGVGFGQSAGVTPSTTASTGASWDVSPNVGGDIDWAIGTNADISLRPDVTFLSEFTMVTTTLGLALKL